ncbi:DNA replication and repair protein RecN [Pseudoxanthomonas sp. GM95]|uniref:DNA repair protein RecN n=1 Tax=Pseudoxanthomonas sp. GM95 TaxID=1881043 RepID=UPI0008BC9AC0|nr:DNA repair protein RecN [Pseudoxanthomonas sp. GM95]SEL04929.1 DNA replication and repair protein RecN [Pseudoxanthomonas sp. GM95]
MLRHLTIKDFAVVRATDMEFGPGMTVISGETGAGKSLLVDALGFLSGIRADAGMVRHGAQRAELSAEFDLTSKAPALAWLAEHALDEAGACQLRRVLRADGGSRAWINGRAVPVSQLAELSGLLVEIHGQHEHQALLSKSSQLALLDAFAGSDAQLAAVQKAAATWNGLLVERERLTAAGDVSDRLNYLQHQLEELRREDLAPAAIETLVASHRRQAHASTLIQACDDGLAHLSGDDDPSAASLLLRTRGELARVLNHEPRLAEVDTLLEGAQIQLEEALGLLNQIRDDLEIDPDQLEQAERRLTRLHDLARKHRVAPEQLDEVANRIEQELEGLRGAGERLAGLNTEIEAARQGWKTAAAALTKARTKAATTLAKKTSALIGELGMGGGKLEVQLEPAEAERPDPQGAERVELLVAANAGQPPRPLRKVASGGELSRISLAIEVAALGSDAVPTMIFDEVDSGIGGAVADIVGKKLRDLGRERQVLCVTHQPQVAAQGHAHYRVSKAPVEGMTQSSVEALDAKARQEELARMLGGVQVSAEARAAAGKLLESVD